MFKTPILFLMFNRPDHVEETFGQIRKVRPKQLFIAADGARNNVEGEEQKCKACIDYVLSQIDWECEIKTLFREENLGCGKAVSSAIEWFFDNVDEGIILEDDCKPDLSFFNYCETLLNFYRDNENIYVIGGSNFQKSKRGKASYYFSAYGHVWGWATWKRAWKNYKFSLNSLDNDEVEKKMRYYFKSSREIKYWINIFNIMKYDPIDTWDYQWNFAQWYNLGINIIPNINLVENIGFDNNATHTKTFTKGLSDRKAYKIDVLLHPCKIKINRVADKYTFKSHFSSKQNIIKLAALKYAIKNFINRINFI